MLWLAGSVGLGAEVSSDFIGVVSVVVAAFVLGGAVKGAVGIGLPAIVLPLLTLKLGLVTAICLMFVPMLVSNLVQINERGLGLSVFIRFKWLIFALALATAVGASLTLRIDAQLAFLAVGVASIAFSASQLVGREFVIDPSHQRWLNPIIGGFAGLLGGLTSLFGPPLVAYLVAMRLPKDEMISGLSLIYLVGTLILYVVLGSSGSFTSLVLTASAAAALPTWAGVALGRSVRNRLDEQKFRLIVTVAVGVLGLDLIRRALA